MVRAAVLSAVNAPLQVAEIDLPAPGPGQVRIKLAAAGVCHSDLSLSNGTLRQPAPPSSDTRVRALSPPSAPT